MSNAIQPSAASSIQELTRSLMRDFDTNGDGQFSVDEFAGFLNAFMASIVGRGNVNAGTGSTPTNVGTTPILPSTGTATGIRSKASNPLPACPPGWNNEKWINASHTTIKYVAGRIMARYEPREWVNPTTREQILADFRAAGLNPTASGKDCCDFNDGTGPIDIVQAASEGGRAWQWNPVN